MNKLSAIIITHNEAQDLPACLDSLAFCDEVVVVDGGSTDGTADIARARGALVHIRPDWPGFGPQKQRALDLATGDWVLSIDADERVPDALAAEIRAAVGATGVAGFRINRLTTLLGRPLRHGGWYPDRVLRLARRAAASFTDAAVHEQMTVEGRVCDLRATMVHLSYASIAELLDKQRRYALDGAAMRRRRQRGGFGAALLHSTAAFLRGYVLFRGFLDGSAGYVAAMARSQETFWRYLAMGWERGTIGEWSVARAGSEAAPSSTRHERTTRP